MRRSAVLLIAALLWLAASSGVMGQQGFPGMQSGCGITPSCPSVPYTQTLTIPMNALASSLMTGVSLLAAADPWASVAMAAASIVTTWAMPDFVIELGTTIRGEACVSRDEDSCPGGTLYMNAMYLMTGQGSLNTIPETNGGFSTRVPVIVNLPDNGVAEDNRALLEDTCADCEPCSVPRDRMDQITGDITATWCLQKTSVGLAFTAPGEAVEILATQDPTIGIDGSDCTATVKCQLQENFAPELTYAPAAVTLSVGGIVRFSVTAEDVDLIRSSVAERLVFSTRGFGGADGLSEPGVQILVESNTRGTSAIVTIEIDESRTDLLGEERQINVRVADASGAHSGRGLYLYFTANKPPQAKHIDLGTYTASEYYDTYGCRVTLPMEATDPELEQGLDVGYEIRFAAGVPSYMGNARPMSWISPFERDLLGIEAQKTLEGLDYMLKSTVIVIPQCARGACRGDLVWRTAGWLGTCAESTALPAGKYVFDYIAYEHDLDDASMGLTSMARCTLTIVEDVTPIAIPSHVWGYPDTEEYSSAGMWKLSFESISLMANDLDANDDADAYRFHIQHDSEMAGASISLTDAYEDPNESVAFANGDQRVGSRIVMKSAATVSGPLDSLPTNGELELVFPFWVTDPDTLKRGESTLTVTVITTNEPPWGNPFYHLTIPLRFGEPMIYALEPAWYEAGCLSFTDPDGDPLRFSLGRPPRKGTVNLLSAGGGGEYAVTMLYEIDRDEALLDHTGEEPFIDTFSVVATDPFGATAETVVEITVDVINSDPVCVDDEVTTPMNTAVEFDVLGNDSDIDGDELTVKAVGVAGNGVGSSVAHNMIRYVPNNGFYGDDTFTYTAEDGYGGSGTAAVTVHVVDTEPPVFVKGPGDVGPLINEVGICGASAKWTAPVSGIDVEDNIGLASVTCTHTSGDMFPVGITTVTYTATDLSGNTTDHTFTVTVVDDEQPTIDGMPSDICVEVPIGITETTVSWIGPTARDNCGVSSLVGTHTPGAVFPLGVTSVVYTATDIHGNIVTDSLGVTVAEAWQLACADKHVTTSNPSGTTVSFADPVVGGCGVTTTFDPVSGSFFDIGDTDVMCEVTDGMRTETCTFTVTVEFVNHDPVANGDVVDLKDSEIATEIDVLKNDSDADGDDLTIIDVSTSSPCGEVWIDADGQSVWFIGMYCQPYLGGTATFTYTISDGNGGEDTATVRVNLPDTGVMPEVAKPPEDDQ